jgi:hypothetical protein
MKRVIFLLAVLLGLIVAPVWSQKPAETKTWPFKAGEELSYEGEFSKLLLRGVNILDLRFAVTEAPAQANHKSAGSFTFTADAVSKGALLKIFRQYFRQHLETTADAGNLAALRTKKEDVQNRRERLSEAVFDYRAGKVTWTERNSQDPNAPPRVIASALESPAYDLVSIWYHLRLRTDLKPGAKFTLPVSDSGAVYQIPVRVVERKTLKTLLGRVACIRLDPEIFGDDKLIGGTGKMSLWLTDDVRHIPVKGTITNNLGKLDVTLKRANL